MISKIKFYILTGLTWQREISEIIYEKQETISYKIELVDSINIFYNFFE